MKKKIIGISLGILTACMCICAHAEYSGTIENCQWMLDDSGVLTISGKGKMEAWYEEYTWWSYKDAIKSVIIEEGIEMTGFGAFMGCSNLSSVQLPDSMKEIEPDAFASCHALQEITIPKNVAYLDCEAFTDCINLKHIYVDSENQSFFTQDNIVLNNVRDISTSELFCVINRLPCADPRTSYTLPENTLSIECCAFRDCRNLKEVIINKDIRTIGCNAFDGCYNLESITLPKDSNISLIPTESFKNTAKLNSISIPDKVYMIRRDAFCGSGIESVVIPSAVTKIMNGAFKNCTNLKTVYYTGSEEQWKAIQIDENNTSLTNAEIIYNYTYADTEIINASSTETAIKVITKLSADGNTEISSFGTAFIPLWLFEDSSTDTALVTYDNSQHNITNGQTYSAELTDIPENYKDKEIAVASFVKHTDGTCTWSVPKSVSINNTILKTIEQGE